MATWAFAPPQARFVPALLVAQDAGKLANANHRFNLPHSERTAALEVLSFVSTGSTSFRVVFSRPVQDNAALRWTGLYQILDTADEPLPVYAVVPEAVASPNYVDLTTREQKDIEQYRLRILEVESSS